MYEFYNPKTGSIARIFCSDEYYQEQIALKKREAAKLKAEIEYWQTKLKRAKKAEQRQTEVQDPRPIVFSLMQIFATKYNPEETYYVYLDTDDVVHVFTEAQQSEDFITLMILKPALHRRELTSARLAVELDNGPAGVLFKSNLYR